MKSTKNKKQLMFMLFLYLIVSTNLMHLSSKINSNNKNQSSKNTLNKKKNQSLKVKYFSRFNLQQNIAKTDLTTKKYPFKNPLGNFLGGLVEKLAYGENRFFDCFPKSWLNNHQEDQEGAAHSSQISGNLTKWGEGLSGLASLAEPVIEYFCKFKEKIIKFMMGHLMKRKLKKFRAMFESGHGARAMRLMSKKYGWGNMSSFGDAIKNGFQRATNFVKDQADKVGKFIKENILDPIFNKWFLPMKNKVLSLIGKIKDFFSSDFLSRIQKCIVSLAANQGKFSLIFQGLKKKFENLKISMSLGVTALIVFAADFIVALVCEYKYLVEGITFILKGVDKKEENERNYDFGRGIGVLFRTFATAPTLAEKINKSRKFKRLYFK